MVAGALVAVTGATPTSFISASGYHIGAEVLKPVGEGAYSNGSAYVVISRTSTETVAGSSLVWQGTEVTGSCEMQGVRESCEFAFANGTSLAATDVFVGGTNAQWSRLYSSGRRVTISVPNGVAEPVPIPF
jgi:hypothetical protein